MDLSLSAMRLKYLVEIDCPFALRCGSPPNADRENKTKCFEHAKS